jgi:predicted nicotinamide N-methyase
MKGLSNMSDDVLDDHMYYEAHITCEPTFDDEAHERFRQLCIEAHAKPAALFLRGRSRDTLQRSDLDSFATIRTTDLDAMRERLEACVRHLQVNGVKVWRYKVEKTLVDSKYGGDVLGLLGLCDQDLRT